MFGARTGGRVPLAALAAMLLSATALTSAGAQTLNYGATGAGGTGAWDNSTANWFDGAAAVPWAGGNTALFGGTAGTVTVSGTVAVGGAAFNTTDYTLTGGTLALSGATPTFTTDAGVSATISSAISGTATLVKSGAGTLTFSGAKTYTGATSVDAGRLVLSNVTGFVSATTVRSGATLSFTGTTNVTAAAPITLNDGAVLENSNPSGTVVLTGTVTSSGSTSINANQAAGTGRGLYLDGGLKGSGTVTINTVNAGTSVALRNNNTTFSGTLIVNGIANAAAGAGSGLALGGPTTSNALINANIVLNGTIELADRGFGSGFFTSAFNWGALSGSGIVVANRQTNGNFGSAIILGHTNDSGSFSGQIIRGSGVTNTVGVTKVGTGTQTLSGASTYVGATRISAGVLSTPLLANGGVASGFGASSNAAANLVLDGGTLQYTGTGVSTNRQFTLTTNGGSIDASGAGALNFTNTAAVALSGTGPRTLTLTGSNTATNTLAAVLGDGGGSSSLVKSGPGRWALTANNSYTGGTILNAGTLQVSADTHLGNAAGALTFNGGTLQNTAAFGSARGVTLTGSGTFQTDADLILSGVISGGGTMTKTGAATLTLTADDTYTGSTTIAAGILRLGDGGTSGGIAGDIIDNAILIFNRSDALSLGGDISGTGSVSQIGTGTTTLTGTNSYTGGTTISAGALQLGDGGTGGSIIGDVLDNAALIFNRSDALGLSGVISGTGTVSQIGTGTTMLAGVNSYSGGTTISAGTLRGSATSFGSGDILDNAALVIDQPADASFANAINGTGRFTKLGAGRLNYTGTGTLTGATIVSAGTLAVNGSLASSAVTVQNGGTLGGNGTVGAATIQSGGTIAPGNSIGTLHVGGAFTQTSGSVYQVEVDPNTNASDLIAVTGTATLQSGAGLNVTKSVPGDYRVGTVYTVLTTTGGRTGTYALSGETTGVSAFLGLRDSYDANNAYLTVVQTQPLTNAVATPNQQAVVDALPPPSSPVTTAVLNSPDIPTAQSAFDQLSASILASAKGALVAHALYVRDATFDRLRDTYCDEERRERPRPGCSWDGPSLWGQGYGGWGGVATTSNAAGLDHATAGFLLGVDIPVAGWRGGVFGGRSRSDLQIVGMDAAAESTEFHLGAYAGTRWDEISLRLGASYSWDSITANRSVAFADFSDRLRSVYNAGASQGFAELGYRMEMWEAMFEPFANLAYVNVRTDGFREVGGPAALTVRADTVENLISTLGVRPSTNIIVDGAELTLRGLAGWRHTFGSVAPGATLAFAGGNAFTVTGAPVARDAMTLEAGVDFTVRDNVSAGLTYGSQLSSRTTDQTVRGTIRVAF